jgi:hypothetical protein
MEVPRYPERDEEVQGPVDRGEAQLWTFCLRQVENLLWVEPAFSPAECGKNRRALAGKPDTPGP